MERGLPMRAAALRMMMALGVQVIIPLTVAAPKPIRDRVLGSTHDQYRCPARGCPAESDAAGGPEDAPPPQAAALPAADEFDPWEPLDMHDKGTLPEIPFRKVAPPQPYPLPSAWLMIVTMGW